MKLLVLGIVLISLAGCATSPRTPLEEYKFQKRMEFSKKMAAEPSLFDMHR